MTLALSFLVGLILGVVGAVLWAVKQRQSLISREALDLSERARAECEARLQKVEQERTEQERKIGALEAEKAQLSGLREQMSREFENVASRVFLQNSQNFREQSERNLQGMLNPLRERISEFQKRVEETYTQESREMFSLKNEIKNIVESNQRITLEANKLTTALRGDVKTQGSWGELVLEKILEASGLRSGQEYIVQATDMKLRSEDGRVQRPDVVINLPESKHLIVDSKVSLVHYERVLSATEEAPRAAALKLFAQSLYQHIDGLAAKSYQNLAGLNSPDFVMLFVPMEGAFSLAMQSEPELFSYAWDKRIVLVSPTTLLATLRTVSSIWNQERQNKNAIEIARQGGQLYDKFASLVTDLRDLGAGLEKSNDQYGKLMGKLSEGKGNLVSRVQRLKELGAKSSKEIPAELLKDFEDSV